MRPPLLRQLKQETLIQHERLEQQLQLLRPEMSLRDYRKLLESFYGFYAPWERIATPVLNDVLPGFLDGRLKTPLLESDLLFLKGDLPAIRQCYDLPDTSGLLPLLGTLYVVEGSTLGGQILMRHFTQKFNISSQEGCAFFASYGSEVGQRWRIFCDILSSHSSSETDPIIVESAVQTFSCLENWLRKESVLSC